LVVVIAAIGGAAGAFVPRIAYRMSVPIDTTLRAGCHACARPFTPGPSGWLHLGDRCPDCGERLGPPAWLTAMTAAVATAGFAVALGASPLLPAFVLVAMVGVVLAAIDLACLRLPDVLVLPTFVVAAATLAVVALARDESAPLVRGLLAAVVLAACYFVLAVVTGGGIGLGDVKLMLVLGLLLGWFGWPFVVAGVVLAHLLHGLVALGALATRRAGRTSLIPMGPALLIGAWCAIVLVPATFALLR
jgi:leader peptidase (prepilin peptidase)/N-methyltransferase